MTLPGIDSHQLIIVLAAGYSTIWMIVNGYTVFPLYQLLAEAGLRSRKPIYVDGRDRLSEDTLPTIDVLIPAYDEGRVIRNVIESVREADYPQDLIQVIVLTEPDDESTRAELDNIRQAYSFMSVDTPGGFLCELTVPPEYPGEPNKPRALDFGFQESYGEIVGVLDAEDIADSELFLHVAGAIEGLGYDAVQGRLDMANEDDGWLNTLFRGEYGYWYYLLMPAFFNAGYPVPLGGTTNFCRRSVLESISDFRKKHFGLRWGVGEDPWLTASGETGPIPWDPLNVTEDFDLGLLLWLRGYDLGLIDVTTREESPITLSAWIKQRTRWQKGKIFTMLQNLREPPRQFLGRFHILFQSALPHLGIVNLTGVVLLTMISFVINLEFAPAILGLLLIGLTMMIQYMVLQAMGYWIVSDAPYSLRVIRAIINAMTLPAYWVLQWGADLRAMWQIYKGSMVWEKTPHAGRHIPEENRK
jgi:cellulose synthase/poly-beta-1,6-N-acetylglucosamine synthase-like glycosyltransferase